MTNQETDRIQATSSLSNQPNLSNSYNLSNSAILSSPINRSSPSNLSCPSNLSSLSKLRVSGDQLIDREGRQVILHGVNMVCKDPARGYVGAWTEEDFRFLRDRGMNVIRLGILWDGLEPEPGRINEALLDRIEAFIDMAEAAGLYVFLDMHQDLYGRRFADGAPEWATLCEPDGYDNTGHVWSDAYLSSTSVQTAFDRFWENAPAPDGIGLQDHLAGVWRRVAERFGHRDCIVGYDLLNEPFPGTRAMDVQGAMVEGFLMAMAQGGTDAERSSATNASAGEGILPDLSDAPANAGILPDLSDPDTLTAAWTDPEGRAQLLGMLTDRTLYQSIADHMVPVNAIFDREVLSAWYQRAADAIREVDTDSILLLEACYFSNMGVRSAIQPVLRNGARDPQQMYSPHGYDLIVDTEANDLWSPERVSVIFDQHEAARRDHGWPMLVGEWGAFWEEQATGRGCGTLEQADQLRRIFETCGCNDTFWCYPDGGIAQQNIDGFRYSDAIVRGVPVAVSGRLLSYQWDPETGVFTCTWADDGSGAESRFWVPGRVTEVQAGTDAAWHMEHSERGCTMRVAGAKMPESRTLHLRASQ